MPRSGGFARRSTSSACRQSSWPRSTASSTRSALSSNAARWWQCDHHRRLREAPLRGRRRQSARPRGKLTRKRDKTYFGYKAHLAVDGERPCAPGRDDPANVHDSRLGEALIQGDEQGFFADRAYDSQVLRETLERARPGRWDRLEGQARPLSARALATSSTTPGREGCAQLSSALSLEQ